MAPTNQVCKDCGNAIEKRHDDSGQRGDAWAETSWNDGRDFQCGLSTSGRHEPGPTTGFKVTITIVTDDIDDLLAMGRKLRDAEDGGGSEITTVAQAVKEVAWLFAHEGTNRFMNRTGVYCEIDTVGAEALP